jgi:hypothetical protein
MLLRGKGCSWLIPAGGGRIASFHNLLVRIPDSIALRIENRLIYRFNLEFGNSLAGEDRFMDQ